MMSGVNLLDAVLPAQDHPAAPKSWPGETLKSSPDTGNEAPGMALTEHKLHNKLSQRTSMFELWRFTSF